MINVGNVYFACDECGIHQQVERRLQIAKKYGDEFQFDHCSCSKIDADFFAGGYCEDAFVEKAPLKNKGRRKTGRAYRRKMRRKTIRKYRDRDGNIRIHSPHLRWRLEGDEFVLGSYVKYPQNSSNKAFFKRVSNRKVRHSEDLPLKGAGYRRVFDYWWTID